MLRFSGTRLILILCLAISTLFIASSCSGRLSPRKPATNTEKPSGRPAGEIRRPASREDSPPERIAVKTRPVPASLKNEIPETFWTRGTERRLDTGSVNALSIIETALDYLGVPHCMGGKTRRCMDCSGLLLSVFAAHGINLPHNSEEQARYGTIIYGTDQLRKGDLVFFTRSYRTNRFITHSGIYTGNNEFIHTSSSRGVTVTSINDPWWSEKFVFGTRIFDN
jgi:murein DD-endopeptidase / murein LD-carboxypeptidase